MYMKLSDISANFSSVIKRDNFYYLYNDIDIKNNESWCVASKFVAVIQYVKNKARVVTALIPEAHISFNFTSDLSELLYQVQLLKTSVKYDIGYYDPVWRKGFKEYLIVHNELVNTYKLVSSSYSSYSYVISFMGKDLINLNISIKNLDDWSSNNQSDNVTISFNLGNPLNHSNEYKMFNWTIKKDAELIINSVMSYIKYLQVYILGILMNDMLSIKFNNIPDTFSLDEFNFGDGSYISEEYKPKLINELTDILNKLNAS